MFIVQTNHIPKVKPLCPVFGKCGGCLYQDISYADELSLKENALKQLFTQALDVPLSVFDPMVASPKEYHYRNRLDLRLLRTKDKQVFIGFNPADRRFGVEPVDQCAIATEAVDAFIPDLKIEAKAKLTEKYRVANLVVRTSDDGRVFWGGIGRRSLAMDEQDYFWTVVNGRKIYFSLDTFFQANLSILPVMFDRLAGLSIWDQKPVLYDLYGGVGLFSFGLLDRISSAYLIEENLASIKCAQYTKKHNQVDTVDIIGGKVEDVLPRMTFGDAAVPKVAFIDPPRAGLSEEARCFLFQQDSFDVYCYLSCNPETLVRDCADFQSNGWRIDKIIPFDFFPKTKHLETFVLLVRS